MTETSEKKENDQTPCSEPSTDLPTKIMAIYGQIDEGKLTVEEATNQMAELLKERRQAKLDCLKKLGL